LDVKDDLPLPDPEDRGEEFQQTDQTLQLTIEGDSVDVGSIVVEQREVVNQYESTVNKWRKSVEEPPEGLEYLMNEIQYGQGTDMESLLTAVAEKNSGRLDMNQVFDDLQELFEGNHIQIRLQSEHR
jgi:hypothetical protein